MLIVGAGMAGLACAVTLHRSSVPFLLFDRDKKVGGRVQTDEINGYRLDRGFQVLLTAYPEAKRFLDYEKLELKSCYPGSRVWYDGKFCQVSDPFRHPLDGICSVFNPIGSFFDKLKVGMLRLGFKSTRNMPDDLSTIEALQGLGFSHSIIDRFWKPFMRGVFLENDLSTSVRKFEETFRLFAQGETTLPRRGIGEIPKQMAEKLPVEQLKLGHAVSDVHAQEIKTEDGKSWEGRAVVLATDFESADRLLKKDSKPMGWNTVDCFYYSFPETELPTERPILHLNGSGEGPINNLNFMSSFTDCAPVGKGLLSASVIGQKKKRIEELEVEARQQLIEWFGPKAQKWENIKVYRIKQAVPVCENSAKQKSKINGIYRCGDYLGIPSIDSAMRSGREVAGFILNSATNCTNCHG